MLTPGISNTIEALRDLLYARGGEFVDDHAQARAWRRMIELLEEAAVRARTIENSWRDGC